METGLAIKDIKFNGAVLKAAQDLNDIVWVGIKWVCNGLGLSVDQGRAQVKKVQTDLVLQQGCVKFDTGVFDPNNETLAIQLDYLPLWLAKISITPAMKKDNPELVEKLITYQLKAKDVLAEAFLQKEQQLPAVPGYQTIQLNLPTYDAQFKLVNAKIDRLYSDMSKFVNVMLALKEELRSPQPIIEDAVNIYTEVMGSLSAGTILNDCREWKANIYKLSDQLIRLNRKFENRGAVLQYLYKYMNRHYGIVWDQEIKDYQERYSCASKPSNIDVVYNKEMLRSIFESVLIDLVSNTEAVKLTDVGRIEETICPLIEQRNDKSIHGCATYRKVYSLMAKNYGVNWKNHITRYMNENKTNVAPSKKILVTLKPSLMKKFEKSVSDLLDVEKSMEREVV